MASALSPTTSALEMVPMPGFSLSGIQSTSTTKLNSDDGLAEGDRHVLG